MDDDAYYNAITNDSVIATVNPNSSTSIEETESLNTECRNYIDAHSKIRLLFVTKASGYTEHANEVDYVELDCE